MYIKKRRFYDALLWFYFIGETLVVVIAGGNFKAYFLISILCFLLVMARKETLNCILSSKVFVFESLWCLSFWFSTVLSDSIKGALLNTISVSLYTMTTFLAMYMLMCNKMTIEQFQESLRALFLVIIVYGLVQLLLFKTIGLKLGLNDFANSQMIGWQIPGFSKEANGHGKLVGFTIAYCLPMLIDNEDRELRKKYKVLMGLALATMLISLTRSAAYADIIVLGVAMLLSLTSKRKARKTIGLMVGLLVLFGIAMYCIENGIIKLDGVSMMKIERFFSLSEEELRSDSSGGFRMEAFDGTLSLWQHSMKTFLVGWGPGQAFQSIRGFIVRVSGLDTLGMLASIGVLGVAAYIVMSISVVSVLMKFIRNNYYRTFCLQLLYGYIFCFATNFIACVLYFPYLWLVVGATEYLEIKYTEEYSNSEIVLKESYR